jgi:MFS family permease
VSDENDDYQPPAGVDQTQVSTNERPPSTVAGLEADVENPPQTIVRHGGTFESFRYRAYSLFWSGALVSNVGSWMQNAALGIIVYTFRSSTLDVGLINFVSQIPTLFIAIPAGALADRVDRRTLIIWCQVALMIQAAALAVLYATGRLSADHAIEALLWVGALGIVGGIFTSLAFPAWQAMLPDLVPRHTLLNGIALNSAQFQSARMLGPLAAGAVVLAGLGVGSIFWINAGSFLFVIAALWVIRPQFAQPRESAASRASEGSWRTITAGVRYAREHRAVGMLIASTAVLTIFGMPYMMLLAPVVDKALLASALTGAARRAVLDREYYLILSANGLGAMIGALVVASLPPTVRRERLARWGIVALSLLLMAFGLSRSLYLSMIISPLAGAMVLMTNSLVNTSIQAQVPHVLRGRVMALFILSFMGLMPLSALLFGAVGEAIGPSTAIFWGAVVLLAWGLFLMARPGLLESDSDPGAVRRSD